MKIVPFATFPMNTEKRDTTALPLVNLRMTPQLRAALENYGKQTGVGSLSNVIRFACVSLLRSDGALTVPPKATGTEGPIQGR